MAKDLTTLKTQANTIANETAEGANTAARVGGAIADIVDWLEENGSSSGGSSGGSSSGGSLTSGSVTTDKIGNGAVTTDKIANGAVTTLKVADNAITEGKLSTALQERLNNLSTGSGDIATGAVTTDKLADNAVTTDKLSTDIKDRLSQILKHYKFEGVVIPGSSAPSGSGNAFVVASQEGIYTYFKGSNGNSLTVDASDTLYKSFIAIIKTDSSGSRAYWTVEYVQVLGSSSGSGSGSTSGDIADGSITEAKLADGAVTFKKIENYNVTSVKLADHAVTSDKIASNAVTSNKIANYSIDETKLTNLSIPARCIQDSSVSFSKLTKELQAKINSLTAGSGDGTVASHTHNISDINLDEQGRYVFPRMILVSNTSASDSSNGGVILACDVCNLYNNWSNNCLGIASEKVYFDGLAYFAKGYQSASDERLKNIEEEDCILPLEIIADAPAIKFTYKDDKSLIRHRGTTAQYWEMNTGDDFVGRMKHGDDVEYLNLETDNLSLTIGLSLARHLKAANEKIAALEERIKALEEQ